MEHVLRATVSSLYTYDSAGILGYILAELEGTQWGHDVAEAAAAYGARQPSMDVQT